MDLQAIRNFTKSGLEGLLLDKTAEAKPLPFSLLAEITNDFSYKQEIGKGGFAVVYKGILDNGAVAVKRLSNSYMYEDQFVREVQCLVKVKHTNIVRFLGYCSEAQGNAGTYKGKFTIADIQERLLCFEYLPEGSLDYYIKDPSVGLAWNSRYHILKGICKGLHYLHSTNVLHLDLKPQNILMGDNMIPKITDFGLSRVLDETQTRISATTMFGTEGYLAPESKSHEITFKFDLYSLGVIIMEILTGKKDRQIVDKVLESWGNRLDLSEGNPDRDQIRFCAQIGFECTDLEPTKRPVSMTDIMDRLAETEKDVLESWGNRLDLSEGNPETEKEVLESWGNRLDLSEGNPETEKEVLESWGNRLDLSEGNPETEKETTQPLIKIIDYGAEEGVMNCIDANQREPLIITGDNYEHVKIWNYGTESQTTQPLIKIIDYGAEEGVIKYIEANHREPFIITGDNCGHVKICNFGTESQKVVTSIKVSKEEVTIVKFIVRKQWLVAVSNDCLVRVYTYEKELEKVTSFKAHSYLDYACCSLDVHPTQPYVLSGGGRQIKLWDWDQDWNCIQKFEEHSDDINELKFNPEDTNSFASASDDRTVKVWSLDSSKSKYTMFGHSASVYCVDFFTRDGQQYLISGSFDKTAKIWDMQKKECVHTLEHESSVINVLSHPTLPVLITGTGVGCVHVWSSSDFRHKTILYLGSDEVIIGFAYLMGSGRLAVAQHSGVSVMEIPHEEGKDGSEVSNEISIVTAD